MKISRSAGYGLMATGYIAQSQTDGLVLASRISKIIKFLSNIFLKSCKAWYAPTFFAVNAGRTVVFVLPARLRRFPSLRF